MNAPPDLQELVRAYGSWRDIPSEAWREYDRKLKAWQAAIRDGVKWQSRATPSVKERHRA